MGTPEEPGCPPEGGGPDVLTEVDETPNWCARVSLVLVVVVPLVVIACQFNHMNALLKDFTVWMDQHVVEGALIFIGVYALGTILFFPMSLLTISAGFVWGWLALPLVAAGATVGMAVAFFMSRYILRGWVQQKLRRNRKFAVVDKMIANDGWTIVGLLRLAPMVPFNLLNYALGLTGIRFIPYIVASSVCVVPGSGIFVYLGTVAGTLDSIFSGKSGAGRTAEILTLVISGVVLLIFTAYVTVSAKRALREAEAATDLDPGSDASDSTP